MRHAGVRKTALPPAGQSGADAGVRAGHAAQASSGGRSGCSVARGSSSDWGLVGLSTGPQTVRIHGVPVRMRWLTTHGIPVKSRTLGARVISWGGPNNDSPVLGGRHCRTSNQVVSTDAGKEGCGCSHTKKMPNLFSRLFHPSPMGSPSVDGGRLEGVCRRRSDQLAGQLQAEHRGTGAR